MSPSSKESKDENWDGLTKAIMARVSYKREYSSKVVDPSEWEACLDLARWAPSAHNAQPWRFVTFYKQDASQQAIREGLVEKMAERFRVDMLKDGLEAAVVEKKTAASKACFSRAPVLILACMDLEVMDAYGDDDRSKAERVMAIQSVSAAIQMLLVAIHSRGLRACWYCAPLFVNDLVKEILGLPRGWETQAFITMGYPKRVGGEPVQARTSRRPVGEITFTPDHFTPGGGVSGQ
ncbi:MAG: nitroreductase family protein [Candidatus Hodarchaeota archaeon]